MKHLTPFSVIITLSGLYGCATMTPEKAASWDTQMLCDTLSLSKGYANNPNTEIIFTELESRNQFSSQELEAINNGSIFLGMSQNAMYCSWGKPQVENSTVGAWGVKIQHVYPNGNYVYTSNGVVDSWQD